MLKVIDPVRWETAKAIFAASFAGDNSMNSDNAFAAAHGLVEDAIERGWLAEVPDEPQPPTSQWRPIAEAEGSEERLLVGGRPYGDWMQTMCHYREALIYSYTHYLPIPEPPARERE